MDWSDTASFMTFPVRKQPCDSETESTASSSAPSPLADSPYKLSLVTGATLAIEESLSDDSEQTKRSLDTMSILAIAPSELTSDERRRRRNEKERLRVRGVKDRLQSLRDDLARLHLQHDNLQQELERRVVDGYNSENRSDTVIARRYLALVKETEQLQLSKQSLEDQLRPRNLHTTAVRTMLNLESDFRLAQQFFVQSDDDRDSMNAALVIAPSPARALVDPIALFEHVLFARPFEAEEAHRLVQETCVEMMEVMERAELEESNGVYGWRGGRVVDGSRLQFRLSQAFQDVSARDLMERTWGLLTDLEGYRQIQPEALQLKILQRINNECWLIGITVNGKRIRHTVLLVARALIHGGYLVTFRTIPISPARQQYVESETGGMYVNIFSWYNFQERVNSAGERECEVIFGGNARNGDTQVLQQLRLTLLAGITRWQAAVGFPRYIFAPYLPIEPKR
ncbi:hypothetical protein Poli38472_014278 [Pythium oligandrum]|uniref:BZIP domain-containing protein n=1 Tax=Pythium oligandrum TaxID=41045 RepID=A0A8K1CIE2_PYTOL|nr:hypothetical protein Poli38472_014278 [Pythium oligandrum]|eukprot:TMW64161.1 hypothetical protein Poli38472_014278 [Pythium oligandrum]